MSGQDGDGAQFPWWLPLIIIGILLLLCCCCWFLFCWKDKDSRDRFFFSRHFTIINAKEEEVDAKEINVKVERTYLDAHEIAQESSTQYDRIEEGGRAGPSGAGLGDIDEETIDVAALGVATGGGASGGTKRDSQGESLELPKHGHPSRLFRARKGNKEKLKNKAVVGSGGAEASKPSRDMDHGKMPAQHRYTSVYQTQGQL